MARYDNSDDGTISLIKIGIWCLIGLVSIVLFFNSFYTVNAGQRGILLTWGAASSTQQGEGLHVKIPFVQTVKKMSVQTLKYDADANAASKDLQTVTTHIATNYHLLDSKVTEIYRNIGIDYSEIIIKPMEQEVTKSITAQYTAEELITKREEVRLKIKDIMTERLQPRGIVVEEISITNFKFSDSFDTAIEQKVTAEQLKLKAVNDLERMKVEAEQAKTVAEGKRDAAIAEAQGQAESIKIVNEQLDKSPNYISYLTTLRWDGALPKFVNRGTEVVPMVSIN